MTTHVKIVLGSSPTVVISAECEKCGKREDQEKATPENGWYNPFYIRQADSFLQTALCPDCCPKISLFMWIRKVPNMRFLNKLYANLFGYFWLPCDSCGRYFGGHEKHGKGIKIDESLYRMTCGNC